MTYQVRSADLNDTPALHRFIHGQNYLHRHLDWRDPLAWLGREPFFILEEHDRIAATLAAPPEPARVAWVRLFGVSTRVATEYAWQALFEPAYAVLARLQPRPTLVSLALRDWYANLLERQGFVRHQDIVVFLYDQAAPPPPLPIDPSIRLRPLTSDDLEQVVAIDHLSFEPIWQLSREDLRYAYQKSTYMTVAELDGQVVAYQMSSSTGMYAHLSRLAVHPTLQRRRIGYALVQDLLVHFLNTQNCWGVTLNTQHNNPSSIALYERIGFRATGERFPVFIYPT